MDVERCIDGIVGGSAGFLNIMLISIADQLCVTMRRCEANSHPTVGLLLMQGHICPDQLL